MARIPTGSTLIDNPISKAPGFKLENVFVFAGIPKIMTCYARKFIKISRKRQNRSFTIN